jgi:serine/threonine-protein kinase RIO1
MSITCWFFCEQIFADFGLSQWFIIDIVAAIEYLHRMEVGSILRDVDNMADFHALQIRKSKETITVTDL